MNYCIVSHQHFAMVFETRSTGRFGLSKRSLQQLQVFGRGYVDNIYDFYCRYIFYEREKEKMFLYPIPREYVEAKLQKRAMENNNIYRRQGSEGNSPTAENGTHRSVENISHRSEMASYPRPNPMGASKPPCNGVCNMYCLCPYILFVFS